MEYIKNLIRSRPDQRIHYADFIQAALYTPKIGYYEKTAVKIGAAGDFYTSTNIGDAFAIGLSRFFQNEIIQRQLPPVIYELGAGEGKLATEILEYLQEKDSVLFAKLTYIIVEASEYHESRIRERLAAFPQVEIYRSIEEIPAFEGIVFSNELFDAFPVHVIEKHQEELYEVYVTNQEDKLVECLGELSQDEIKQYIDLYNLTISEGQRIEIPLAMTKLYSEITSKLKKGLVVTIDYGYTNEEWQLPMYKEGSLRGFFKHQLVKNVLKHVGEMDITSHIHFDTLKKLGNEVGLQEAFWSRQDEFLLATGILEELENNRDTDPFSKIAQRNRAIRSLVLSSGFSEYFRVLVQSRNT